jgi:hypothetical protein
VGSHLKLGVTLGEGGKNQERTNIWSFLKMSAKNYKLISFTIAS